MPPEITLTFDGPAGPQVPADTAWAQAWAWVSEQTAGFPGGTAAALFWLAFFTAMAALAARVVLKR